MRPFCRGHVKIILILLFFFTVTLLFFQNGCALFPNGGVKLENVLRPTSTPNKRVTKSLSELRKMTEPDSHVLMFNFVPGAGSEMFVLILQWLQGSNNFRHIRLRSGKSGKIDEQKAISDEVFAILRDLGVPLSFDCSTYFINFTKFGTNPPTYFNLIRNPRHRISTEMWRNISRSNEENIDNNKNLELSNNIFKTNFTIPYFCGYDSECNKLNSVWALNKAKENVEKFFPVVGLLEYLEETLYVLEKKVRYYFHGSQEIYMKKFKDQHEKWKNRLPIKMNAVEKYFENTLVTEYEFYHWIKKRLLSQVDIYKAEEIQSTRANARGEYNFQIEQP